MLRRFRAPAGARKRRKTTVKITKTPATTPNRLGKKNITYRNDHSVTVRTIESINCDNTSSMGGLQPSSSLIFPKYLLLDYILQIDVLTIKYISRLYA